MTRRESVYSKLSEAYLKSCVCVSVFVYKFGNVPVGGWEFVYVCVCFSVCTVCLFSCKICVCARACMCVYILVSDYLTTHYVTPDTPF